MGNSINEFMDIYIYEKYDIIYLCLLKIVAKLLRYHDATT